MKNKTFTLRMGIGFWEGELITKALENYTPKKKTEEWSKQDLINCIKHQMERAKSENECDI